jgi:hypothetical protein
VYLGRLQSFGFGFESFKRWRDFSDSSRTSFNGMFGCSKKGTSGLRVIVENLLFKLLLLLQLSYDHIFSSLNVASDLI